MKVCAHGTKKKRARFFLPSDFRMDVVESVSGTSPILYRQMQGF